MKKVFKLLAFVAVIAATLVSCKKTEELEVALKGIKLNKTAVELAVNGTETLTVTYDPENATTKPEVEWSSSAPAVATVAKGVVTAVAAGEATITAKAGNFTATCKVTVTEDGPEKPTDFTSPDWANIGAITNGNHTFKFTKDDKNAYFFSERTSEGRYNDIWGGEGYIYFAFDFDNNLETGETLNNNGKYEYIGFIYCFGEKPKVEIVKAGDCLPEEYTVENIIARGSADDNSVKVEYCVPLADLPQLPENFTIYTWGNKDMAKVVYPYPYQAPEAPDLTWADMEEANAICFFQYRNIAADWSNAVYDNVAGNADAFENLSVANGVYTLTLAEQTFADWQSQLFIRPNPEIASLPLKADKNYLVSLKFKSNTDCPVFVKLQTYGPDAPKHEGATVYEFGRKAMTADKPLVLGQVVAGVACDNVNFVLDFGGNPENTIIEISEIKVEVSDLPLGPVGPEEEFPEAPEYNFNYTPSDEWNAATNLWKPVQDGMIFKNSSGLGHAADLNFVTFNQSTYRLFYPVATSGDWSQLLWAYPDANHKIALDASKTYMMKLTLHSNVECPRALIKVTRENPNNGETHEGEWIWESTQKLPAGQDVVFEDSFPGYVVTPDAGKDNVISNLAFVFDFGGNPKDCLIFIKDIILAEVGGGETGDSVSDVVAMDDASEVVLQESLVTAKTQRGVIVTDGTKAVYAYEQTVLADVKVGDKITLKGSKTTFNGVPEIENVTDLVVVSSGNAVTYPTPKDITATVTEYSASEAEFVSLTGTLAKSGNYYNVNIDGVSTKQGSIVMPIADLNADSYDKKDITITGYFNGLSGGGKYVNIITVKIEEAGAAGAEPTDLSALKANCYVISEAGAYKFPAVKGNSSESVGTVASAAIVWETYNNTTVPAVNSVIAKVDAKDGFIVFETPATLQPGNALIAAKDASGNILWSWHIWIPKNAITTSQFGLGGQSLMDRNLGALEVAVASAITPESQGMLYSWGRKDPFLGNAVIGEKTQYAVAEGQAQVTIGESTVLMTVAESIKNPTTFVQTGSDDNKDWCSEADAALVLWGAEKTIYDPCPAGYQVPYNPWDDAKNGMWNLKADDAILTTLKFSKNVDEHWFQMGDPATVFPICGYLDQDGYKNRGARAYYWSARSTGAGVANVIRVDSSKNYVTDERKSRGGNVRCVVTE